MILAKLTLFLEQNGVIYLTPGNHVITRQADGRFRYGNLSFPTAAQAIYYVILDVMGGTDKVISYNHMPDHERGDIE